MNEHEGNVEDRELALALRRLDNAVVVPEADPAREAALMAAFDAAQLRRTAASGGRQYLVHGGARDGGGGAHRRRIAPGPDWTSRSLS